MDSGQILYNLISEDFGISGRGRWFRSNEHSSLVLDFEKGIFYFNAEGIVGDPLVYLTEVRKWDFNKAKEYLKQLDYIGTFVYHIKGNNEDVIVYPKLVEVFYNLGKNKNRREYFYRRGLTDSTIDRFQLGWYNGYNTIPVFEDGVFKNFQFRKDNPKTIRNYYTGVGPLIFNVDILKIVNKVYIVEGPIDALILIQNGLPAISTGFVLPEWYSRFIYQDEIYLLFDNDKAGLDEAKRISRVLGLNRCKIYCFWDFEEKGYDPVDFFRDGHTTQDLLNLVENNSKFEFEL